MNEISTTLTLKAAKLITGFFCNTLTEGQRKELDDWLIESEENMKIFETLLDIVEPMPVWPDNIPRGVAEFQWWNRIAPVVMKSFRQPLTVDEQQQLDLWLNAFENNKKLYDWLADPANREPSGHFFQHEFRRGLPGNL